MIDKILNWFPEEEIIKANGFDEAIIGIDDSSMRLISLRKWRKGVVRWCGGLVRLALFWFILF
jgi:hypothetical protein